MKYTKKKNFMYSCIDIKNKGFMHFTYMSTIEAWCISKMLVKHEGPTKDLLMIICQQKHVKFKSTFHTFNTHLYKKKIG